MGMQRLLSFLAKQRKFRWGHDDYACYIACLLARLMLFLEILRLLTLRGEAPMSALVLLAGMVWCGRPGLHDDIA